MNDPFCSTSEIRTDDGKVWVPVSLAGVLDIMKRCDVNTYDSQDPNTWGSVNFFSYRFIGDALYVLLNSHEGQRTGAKQ